MARARIIFRGLMAFAFDEAIPDPAAARDDEDLGTMTVLLVSGSGHGHDHEPRLRFIADEGPRGGNGRGTVKQLPIRHRRIDVDWASPTEPDGVRVSRSVLGHVPRLQDLIGGAPYARDADYLGLAAPAKLKKLVVSQIVVPRGRLVATKLVWCECQEHHPQFHQPVRMAGLGLPAFHMASELVVETSRDGNAQLNLDYETFTTNNKGQLARLHRFVPASGHAQEVPPDTIEVLVTNFTHQRPVMAPWSVHYQWFFLLQQDPTAGSVRFTRPMLDAIRARLPKDAASRAAFDHDLDAMGPGSGGGTGFPFPYIEHPHVNQRLTPLRSPDFRPICPFVLV